MTKYYIEERITETEYPTGIERDVIAIITEKKGRERPLEEYYQCFAEMEYPELARFVSTRKLIFDTYKTIWK